MGMFRETDSQEVDIIKEMAEGLGSSGIRLDDILDQVEDARKHTEALLARYREDNASLGKPSRSVVNHSIKEYNQLVDKAKEALRWLLIQREACGFRTHRDVNVHYPIPAKIKTLKS